MLTNTKNSRTRSGLVSSCVFAPRFLLEGQDPGADPDRASWQRDLLSLRIVEEIVKVVRTSQERCHHFVERIMEASTEIIKVVRSNPQDVPVQECFFLNGWLSRVWIITFIGVWKKSFSICLLKYTRFQVKNEFRSEQWSRLMLRSSKLSLKNECGRG